MRFLKVFALLVAVLIMYGCSSSGNTPIATNHDNAGVDLASVFNIELASDVSVDETSWQAALSGQLVPDGQGGFFVEESRDSQWIIDATSFIRGAGAFSIEILNVAGNLFEIDLTLENQTSLIVYDVRIIFNQIGASKVVNPDSYTAMYSSQISPYISFAKTDVYRMFPIGPGVTDTQPLFLEYNGGSVGFTIIVSMPDFCDEPYEIHDINLMGQLNDEDGGWASLSCKVEDHQWDLEYVAADLTLFVGMPKYMVANPEEPDNFEVYFENELLVDGGVSYPIWIATKSFGSPVVCYNLVQIPVEGGVDPPIVTITTPAVDPFSTSDRFTIIAGTIENFDGDEATIEVNGDAQVIAVDSGTFNDEVVLFVGPNEVKVIANGPGGIGMDTVHINCTATSADLWVRLTWDKDNTDVDLYTTEPGGFTCWYADKVSPHTGAQLDLDDTSGYGPEHYYLSAAEGHTLLHGTYEIDVHYYSDHGTSQTVVSKILIYKEDDYYGEWSHIMSKSNPWENGPANRRTGKASWWDNVADIDL